MATATGTSTRRPRSALERFTDILGLERMSRPEQARYILTATGLIVSVVLVLWLLLWILLYRPSVAKLDFGWVDTRASSGPVVVGQAKDFAAVGQPIAPGNTGELAYDAIPKAIEDVLKKGRDAAVIYLSAPGVSEPSRGFFLPPSPGGLHVVAPKKGDGGLVTLEAIVGLVGREPYARRNVLLILDASQIDTDRSLGVFGNGFVDRVREIVAGAEAKAPNLAVLCSAEPGQVSWASEVEGRSAFGHFVALGISGEASKETGRRLTAGVLAEYVREHVAEWAAANRQAAQTPVLYSRDGLDFPIRELSNVDAKGLVLPEAIGGERKEDVAAKKAEEAKEKARNEQDEKEAAEAGDPAWLSPWSRIEALRAHRPERSHPRLWRSTLDGQLRLEQLGRAGMDAGAGHLSTALDQLEAQVSAANRPGPSPPPRSLAEADRIIQMFKPAEGLTPPGWYAALESSRDSYRATLDETLDRLTLGDTPEEPAAPEAPKDEPKAEEPAAPEALPRARARSKARPPTKAKAGVPGPGSGPEPQAAPPAAPPAGKEGGVRKEPLRARTRARSLASESGNWPKFVEGQPLDWALRFARELNRPNVFEGPRGELLARVVESRALAEKAMVFEPAALAWVRPIVDRADGLRRRAQDQMFAADSEGGDGRPDDREGQDVEAAPGSIDRANEDLDRADELYEKARTVGQAIGDAEGVFARAASELPYYGEWSARRSARSGGDLEPRLVATLERAGRLGKMLADGPPPPGEDDGPIEAGGNALAALANEVRSDVDAIAAEYQGEARRLAENPRPSWREIDDALRVPFLDVKARKSLLAKLRSPRVAGTLPAPGEGTPAGSGASSRGEAFWTLARNLARLERGLLEMAELSPEDRSALADAYSQAAATLNPGAKPDRFAPFARFGEVSRGVREALTRAVEQRGESARRAARVLARVDLPDAADPLPALIRKSERDRLLWAAERLLDDFAPEHAAVLIADAESVAGGAKSESEARFAALRARADGLKQARLQPRADAGPGRAVSLTEWEPKPLPLQITSGKTDAPEGQAAVFLLDREGEAGQPDPLGPLLDVRAGGVADSGLGLLVPVGPQGRRARVTYELRRARSSSKNESVTLTPIVFYRGRSFRDDRPIAVGLGAVSDRVAIRLRQTLKEFRGRKVVDQFDRHENEGWLHPETTLKFAVVLKHQFKVPTDVKVTYGFDGPEPGRKTKKLALQPSVDDTSILDEVYARDIPRGERRTYTVTVEPANPGAAGGGRRGEPLARRPFLFGVMTPPEFMAAVPDFNPQTRRFELTVAHFAGDKVTGPSRISVFAMGRPWDTTWVDQFIWPGERLIFYIDRVPGPLPKFEWALEVEKTPRAFTGTIETGDQPPQPTPPAP